MGGTSTPPRSPVPVARIGTPQRTSSQPNMVMNVGYPVNYAGGPAMMGNGMQQQQQQQIMMSQQHQLQQQVHVHEKPPFSFPCLIGLALDASDTGRMSVSQIYDHITGKFPYFKTAKAGWKNSVRHNLSLNKFFQKLERRDDEAGKGSLWGIVPENKEQLMRDIQACKNRFAAGTRQTSRAVPPSPAPKTLPYQVTRVNSAPVMNVPMMKVEPDSFGPMVGNDFRNTGRGATHGLPGNRRMSLPAQIMELPEDSLMTDFTQSINDLLDASDAMTIDATEQNSLLNDETTMTAWIGGPPSPTSDVSVSSGSIDMTDDFEGTWQQYFPDDLTAYMGSASLGDAWPTA